LLNTRRRSDADEVVVSPNRSEVVERQVEFHGNEMKGRFSEYQRFSSFIPS
jgi:hypothetical protein